MPKNKSQKILIPRGTIDPNEDTLIEIPRSLQERPVVVASRGPNQTNISYRSSHVGPPPISNVTYQPAPIPSQTIYDPASCSNNATYYPPQPQPIAPIRSQLPTSFTPSCNSTIHSTSINYHTAANDISAALLADLNSTEIEEKNVVQQKLEAFQEARRQFLLETTTMATSTSPSASSCYANESVFDQTYSGQLPHKKKRRKCLDNSRESSSSIRSNCSQRKGNKKAQAKFEDSDDDEETENISCVCPSKASL